MWCKKCGSAIPGDAKFCSSCGTPVPGASVQASEDAVIEVQPAAVEVTPAEVQPAAAEATPVDAQPIAVEATPVEPVGTQPSTVDTPPADTQAVVQPEVIQDPGATYNPQQTAQTGYTDTTGQVPVSPGVPQQGTSYTYNTTYNTTQVPYAAQVTYPREKSGGLLMAAFILNIVCTVLLAVFILPLAWCIPMTVRSYGIYKGKKPNTVAFGVCTLLFVSLISGILMLVADKDE